jgi:hypothetical protein
MSQKQKCALDWISVFTALDLNSWTSILILKFLLYLQGNGGIATWTGQDNFLPNPSQFMLHQPSYH